MKQFIFSIKESICYEMQGISPKSKLTRYGIYASCILHEALCVFLRLYCKWRGHKIYDDSSAGPESGNMDHGCSRCGAYWSVPLY